MRIGVQRLAPVHRAQERDDVLGIHDMAQWIRQLLVTHHDLARDFGSASRFPRMIDERRRRGRVDRPWLRAADVRTAAKAVDDPRRCRHAQGRIDLHLQVCAQRSGSRWFDLGLRDRARSHRGDLHHLAHPLGERHVEHRAVADAWIAVTNDDMLAVGAFLSSHHDVAPASLGMKRHEVEMLCGRDPDDLGRLVA
jgi:hypothetical protein